MIERKFVAAKKKEYEIEQFIAQNIPKVGLSYIKLQKTPLGEKIIIYASRPGLIVGTKGQNIRKLTEQLKKRFKLENPQIEMGEVENINLDAQIVAERIADMLERFGTSKFKGIGHKAMENAMNAGALGIEILISGKIPGSRAKSWRFYQGYLKKCGDIALTGVSRAITTAHLKAGNVGVKVRIMPPTIKLIDRVDLNNIKEEVVEEVEVKVEEKKPETKKEESPKEKPAEKEEAKEAPKAEEKTEEVKDEK